MKRSLYDTFRSRRLNLKFSDRYSAANLLSNLLTKYKKCDKVAILAIPRGGVIIAYVICINCQ